jgi:hypothetical protein
MSREFPIPSPAAGKRFAHEKKRPALESPRWRAAMKGPAPITKLENQALFVISYPVFFLRLRQIQ